jgi:8-oxo-dGTP pyrophosphatase MutT (NUDIX family)
MYFTQKIYYNNKPLILTTSGLKYMGDHTLARGYMLLTGAFVRNFRLATQHLDKPGTLGAIIEDVSADALLQELQELYEPVDAGGGVVYNEKGGVLMIYRRGKWDLPKGKKDRNELIEDCALREVKEETGIVNLSMFQKICETYHIYDQSNHRLLKRTFWYKMKSRSTEPLTPQLEENIIEVKWFSEKDLSTIVFKSYHAVQEVLRQAGLKF